MNNQAKIYITGVGMITSIGADAKSTVAAVKAGINRYRETMLKNISDHSIVMASVPNDALPDLNLDNTSSLTLRQKRMLKLVTPALKEVFEYYEHDKPIPLFLAVPEKIQNCPLPLTDDFLDHLIAQTDSNIHRDNSRLVANGKAAGIEVIDMAFKYFEATGNDYVIVGGVDSHFDLFLLGKLDKENRIKVEGSMDAFVPGEAASFILLASERIAKKSTKKILSCLYKPGLSKEDGHRYSEEPYKGDGLANSFRDAIHNGAQKIISFIYSSMNGENFGVKEYGVAVTRNSKSFTEDFTHIHPGDCFGDIGAAFGSALITIVALTNQHTKSDDASLIYCSSEMDGRAAIYITKI